MESRCECCKYYAKLECPFYYDKEGYKDGVTVFGFCAKSVHNNFYFYPVYIPDSGVCKNFKPKRKSEAKRTNYLQIDIFET